MTIEIRHEAQLKTPLKPEDVQDGHAYIDGTDTIYIGNRLYKSATPGIPRPIVGYSLCGRYVLYIDSVADLYEVDLKVSVHPKF